MFVCTCAWKKRLTLALHNTQDSKEPNIRNNETAAPIAVRTAVNATASQIVATPSEREQNN